MAINAAYPTASGSGGGAVGNLAKKYRRNVSNAVGAGNSTASGVATNTTLPMLDDGANSNFTANVAAGKLEFDATFNTNKGGVIVDNMAANSDYVCRLTIVNLGANTSVTGKAFLVFDKTVPGTGVRISSSPVTAASTTEQAFTFPFYDGGIEAIYPQVFSAADRNYQLNGFYVLAFEDQ
jgi:hypothetical protein